jgi:hypothetical protein
MIEDINSLKDCVSDFLKWVKKNHPEQYESKFIQLIEERRKLKKIQSAERENPAIAAFGESQKGKSYLIGNLLQKDKEPFKIKLGDGQEINFVRNINPIGEKKEATGVVTRFTSFSRDEKRYNAQYPVIAKLLSVCNLVTILCDGYYNDIVDSKQYSDSEIKAFSSAIYDKYISRPEIVNAKISADEVLDIKSYLAKFVNSLQNLCKSSYFETVALIIDKVPHQEWIDVFKYLWHENPILSALFSRLVIAMERLSFSNEVYTSIDAVEHHGDNKNTILSVSCLNGLDEIEWDKTCDVYIRQSECEFLKVPNFLKSELCAICSEVIFKIEKEYLSIETPYYYEPNGCDIVGNMPVETKSKLPNRVTKDLLLTSDLLDFPGARNRLKVMERMLENQSMDDDGISNSVQLLLRGKVAFLFNHYSDCRIINILLFCHDNENPSVTDMYSMINGWVENYVGRNSAERRETISNYGGVAPLFVVGTKFNVDMIYADNKVLNSDTALAQRWTGRFNTILYTQVFKAGDVDWFRNWDAPGSTFKNCYMLRDFKYSADTGSGSKLYNGFVEDDPLSFEKELLLPTDFYQALKRSFVENPDVQKFFEDPALAFDVAASKNNDGSLNIIGNLSIVARNANKARAAQFASEMAIIKSSIHKQMASYYVPEDSTEIILENVRKATAMVRELDFTCNNDNYFFGHLIQALQLTEAECLKIVHSLLYNSQLATTVNEFREYELIRIRCDDFRGCLSDKDRMKVVMNTYGFASESEAQLYLSKRSINCKLLFSGEYKKKMNSSVIVSEVLNYWQQKIKSIDFMNTFAGECGFDSIVMSNFVDNIWVCMRALDIPNELETSIAEYVNVMDPSTINELMVADILASTISEFITDFGYSRLSKEQKAKAFSLASSLHLPEFKYIRSEKKSYYNDEELTKLFDEMNSNPKSLTSSFENNYYSWIEYMMVSHIIHLQVPEYDIEENAKLFELLKKLA